MHVQALLILVVHCKKHTCHGQRDTSQTSHRPITRSTHLTTPCGLPVCLSQLGSELFDTNAPRSRGRGKLTNPGNLSTSRLSSFQTKALQTRAACAFTTSHSVLGQTGQYLHLLPLQTNTGGEGAGYTSPNISRMLQSFSTFPVTIRLSLGLILKSSSSYWSYKNILLDVNLLMN